MSDMNDSAETDEEFADIEALLRDITADDAVRFDPPSDLWDSIAAELGTHDSAAPSTPAAPAAPVAPVVSLDSRRRWATTAILGAAAAIVIAIAGVVVVTRGGNEATVLANADLVYDPAAFDPLGADAAANVSLVDDDGNLLIEINAAQLPEADAGQSDLEIWLIHPDADGNVADLVSLGYVDPESPGEYAVPAGYDPEEFSIVDISVEPRDGVETHSGRSILRGALIDA